MTRNGKDRLAAALGESYPRVWRGLGLEAKFVWNLPDIQDKKRPRADDRVGHPYPARLSLERLAVGSGIKSGFRLPFEPCSKSSGLRSRRSGIRYGSSGSGAGAGPNLYLMLNTRTRDLMAETRDLRMRSYN